jgi:phosphatidylglycerophosphate synthase
MVENFLQIPFLRTVDPVWVSLGPLLTINVLFLMTLLFFWFTYRRRPKTQDVDLKEHSRFLSRFLKEYWYWLTSPIVNLMVKLHITPNVLTFCGFLLSCVAAYFFSLGMIGAGGWFMIFGATFDMFDGQIARLTGRASKSGAFFDSVMDRFGEAVVFLGLAGLYRNSWILYFTILGLVGSMMVSYTRARGEGVGVDVKSGFMQRPERIVYLGVGSIFSPIIAYFFRRFVPSVPLDVVTIGAIVLIAIFTNITALHRMGVVMKTLDPLPRDKGRTAQLAAGRSGLE